MTEQILTQMTIHRARMALEPARPAVAREDTAVPRPRETNEISRRAVKKGEPLAMLPEALRAGPQGMWWDFYTPVPENERCGTVAVVHVRGSLDHHRGYGCDSYEGILDRVRKAFAGTDMVERAERDARWNDDVEIPQARPPSAVVLRIDSPGGVVSGLNQTVFELRKLAKASGIPLVAYVDELAASAAYAIACACDEIVLPASAIAGSVGVISTMYDQTAADEKMGVRFVTLTSGTRKADGHPHVAISDAAISAEQKRVDRLAMQFFKIVAGARPVSIKEVQSYQAGIFLGAETVRAGLADAVMGWDAMIASLSEDADVKEKQFAKSNGIGSPKPSAARSAGSLRQETKRMSLVALNALVKRTSTAIASEKDPKEKARLAKALVSYKSALEAYKKEKHVKETHETEEGEEEEEEESEEESSSGEEEDEESEESEAKGNESDRKEEGGDDEEPDDDDEGDAKKAAKAVLAGGAAGRKALGSLTAIFQKAKRFDALSARVAKIEADTFRAQKSALIDEAVAQRRITRQMAAQLRTKNIEFVRGTLEMHKRAMVNIDEEALHVADGKPNGDLPAAVMHSINQAVAAANLPQDEQAKRREALITAHRERMAKANGAEGRY